MISCQSCRSVGVITRACETIWLMYIFECAFYRMWYNRLLLKLIEGGVSSTIVCWGK